MSKLSNTNGRVFYSVSIHNTEAYHKLQYNDRELMKFIKLGLVHLTPEDASLHGHALRSFFD